MGGSGPHLTREMWSNTDSITHLLPSVAVKELRSYWHECRGTFVTQARQWSSFVAPSSINTVHEKLSFNVMYSY